jgi:hypothetical protein
MFTNEISFEKLPCALGEYCWFLFKNECFFKKRMKALRRKIEKDRVETGIKIRCG